MDISRRDFFRIGKGAAAAAIIAGLGLASTPRDAHAIVGIDDALLGAVVVAVATLGGYAFYNQYSGNLGLQAVGASFGNYVSNAPNRTAAAAAAAQIAATYGLTTTQARFETAAESISSGAGAFADAMAAAAESGRLTLDGLVTGTGDLVGAFRELVAGYIASGVMSGDAPMTVPDLTTFGEQQVTLPVSVGVMDPYAMGIRVGIDTLPVNPVSALLRINKNYANMGNSAAGWLYLYGTTLSKLTYSNGRISGNLSERAYCYYNQLRYNANTGWSGLGWTSTYADDLVVQSYEDAYLSPSMLRGGQLPVVDRPVDAPDVIGAGWDSVPLATDLVISPTTGEVVTAGSVPLPTSIPTTAGDYAAALQGALAGVVTDAIALPLAISVPVTVATPLGVETMPLSQAISTETSLQLDYAPDIPISPVLSPVEVPEGPWTPAIDLPFTQVWPFNMIYTFIDTLGALGNAG